MDTNEPMNSNLMSSGETAASQPPSRKVLKAVVGFVVLAVLIPLLAEAAVRQFVDPVRYIPQPYIKIDPNVQAHVNRMTELRDGPVDDHIDIVLSGTSIVGVGLDPTILSERTGQNVYNSSIGCANLAIQSDWLPNWVADFAEPDLVVIGVNPSDFDETSCVRDWDSRADYDKSGFDFDWELYNVSSLWRQREFLSEPQNWRVFWDKEEIASFWDINIRTDDGFWEVLRFKEDIDLQTFMLNPDKNSLVFHDITKKSLADAITGLVEADIEVVVLEFPTPQRLRDNLTDPSGIAYDEASEIIREVAETNGAEYLRNDDPSFRDNLLFIDESHLTPEGAEKFSLWTAEQLASR